jgi:hypothetical protein
MFCVCFSIPSVLFPIELQGHILPRLPFLSFHFFGGWGGEDLNLGLHTCNVGTILLSFYVFIFLKNDFYFCGASRGDQIYHTLSLYFLCLL